MKEDSMKAKTISNLKKAAALILAGSMLLSLNTAVYADETADETAAEAFDEYPHPRVKDKLRVGCIVMDMSSDSFTQEMNQARRECEHRGWEFIDGSCEGDDAVNDAIKNLINQDVDAIVLGATSMMDAKVNLIAEAREKGIGFYSNDNAVVDGVIAGTSLANGVAAAQMMYKIGNDYHWNLSGAVIVENTQLSAERGNVAEAMMDNVYPNFRFLAEENADNSNLFYLQAAYEYAQTWLQQYGDELGLIFTIWDGYAMSAAEAVIQSGDEHGETTVVAGMGGGNDVWKYIRDDTPLKYTYSQPFELYTHNMFEIIDQIQCQGLNPGDEGCDIAYPGDIIYSEGMVTTMDNVPAVGESVHAVFDYYGLDPEDPDAWFNWPEGPAQPIVEDGTEDFASTISGE